VKTIVILINKEEKRKRIKEDLEEIIKVNQLDLRILEYYEGVKILKDVKTNMLNFDFLLYDNECIPLEKINSREFYSIYENFNFKKIQIFEITGTKFKGTHILEDRRFRGVLKYPYNYITLLNLIFFAMENDEKRSFFTECNRYIFNFEITNYINQKHIPLSYTELINRMKVKPQKQLVIYKDVIHTLTDLIDFLSRWGEFTGLIIILTTLQNIIIDLRYNERKREVKDRKDVIQLLLNFKASIKKFVISLNEYKMDNIHYLTKSIGQEVLYFKDKIEK